MICADNITYVYPSKTGVFDISLTIPTTGRIALVGACGSGKSTLARIIAGSLIPTKGVIKLDDIALNEKNSTSYLERVGYVRQDPTAQILGVTVAEDIVFGLRNLGFSQADIYDRIAQTCDLLGIEDLLECKTESLSGGQTALVALASTLATNPQVLVVDEVTTHLDRAYRTRINGVLAEFAEAHSVVEVTHSVEEAIQADHIILLSNGHITWQGTPAEFIRSDYLLDKASIQLDSSGRYLRILIESGMESARAAKTLSNVYEGTKTIISEKNLAGTFINTISQVGDDARFRASCSDIVCGDSRIDSDAQRVSTSAALEQQRTGLVARGLSVAVGDQQILSDINITVEPGELCLIVGPSGSGKTTLSKALAGLVDVRGSVTWNGESSAAPCVCYQFQRPEDQLFMSTVEEDVAFGPLTLGKDERSAFSVAHDVLRKVGFPEDLWQASPFELSGGQMRMAGLAGVLALQPGCILFDEPTSGLDKQAQDALKTSVQELLQLGTTIVIVTHDMDQWIDLCSCVVLLKDGHKLDTLRGSAIYNSKRYRDCNIVPPFISILATEGCGE